MFGIIFTQRENKQNKFSMWKRNIYKNMNNEIISRKTAEPFILHRNIGMQKFQSYETK